ncbi:MAG TPA: hypothetical protein VN213_17245 [Solirubrobacteraceae bacterium]|nr:hypothetical protein [Solirubrobacteraceae bacterium]
MSTIGLHPSPRGLAAGIAASWLPRVAAALSLSAAIAHFGAVPPHLHDWWAHGAFFVVCGALQAAFAGLILWRPSAWLALTGVAGTLAVLALYVVSRTYGAPLGPHAGVPEPVEAYDLTTAAGEFALVVVLVAMLGEKARRWAMRLVMLVAMALWAGKATGFLA